MSLTLERRGNLALVQNQHYQIDFDLSKGTWNYYDSDGYGVIRNAYTKIILNNGTNLTTVDAKFREFTTQPPAEDQFGRYQQIIFSYEPQSRQLRTNLYLKCYHDQPYLVFDVGVENLESKQIRLSQIVPISVSPLAQLDDSPSGIYLSGEPESYQLFLDTHPMYNNGTPEIHKGLQINQNRNDFPCYNGEFFQPQSKKSLVFGFLTAQKWWSSVQVGYQGQTDPDENGYLGLDQWAIYHNCENMACLSGGSAGNGTGYRGKSAKRKKEDHLETRSESIYLNFSQDRGTSFETYAQMLNATASSHPLQDTGSDRPGRQNNSAITANDQVSALGSSWAIQPLLPSVVEIEDGKIGDSLQQKSDFIRQQKQDGYLDDIEYIQVATLPNLLAVSPKESAASTKSESDNKSNTHPMPIEGVQEIASLRATVADLHRQGLKASLRLSPFCLPTDAEQAKSNFVLKGERQQPTSIFLPGGSQEVSLLDLSHKGAQAQIHRQIQALVDECRIDLLHINTLPYVQGPLKSPEQFSWHNKSLTAIQLYQQGLRLLTEAVESCHHSAILVGEHLPVVPSIGAFSAHRFFSQETIGDQLWLSQQNIKQMMFNYAKYLPLNRLAWSIEFGTVTVDEPNPINDVHMTATVAALSGGSITCADPLDQMKPDRLEILDKLFPLLNSPAQPVDLHSAAEVSSRTSAFSGLVHTNGKHYPQIWNLPIHKENMRVPTKVGHIRQQRTRQPRTPTLPLSDSTAESWNVVGVFNWEEIPSQVSLDLTDLGLEKSKTYLVHDFWNRQYLGSVQDALTLMDMAPQSARLLCIRPERKVPQLLSTDLHFSQGGSDIISTGWDKQSQSLLVACRAPRQSGTVFLYLPEDYLPVETACVGAKYNYRWQEPIHQIDFSKPEHPVIQLSVRFTKVSR